MFGRKKDRDNLGKIGTEVTSRELGTEAVPPRPYGRVDGPPVNAPRPPATDMPRRLPDITAPATRRSDARPSPEADSKRLLVGREIVLTGEIKACERLVIEGRVEASLTDIRSIEIAETGSFKGTANIETADIAGRFEGDLVVQGRLLLRATARVQGSVRYGQLEVERGGMIGGQIEALPAPSRPADGPGEAGSAEKPAGAADAGTN